MIRLVRIILFFLGLTFCFYPLISGFIERQNQKNMITTYKNVLEIFEDNAKDIMLEDAKEYNNMLYQTNGLVGVKKSQKILSDENYYQLLNLTQSGMIGSLEIPKINVNLPIYHGTSEEVLSAGVGHVKESSFPIGGENTRAVLAGHRGLPNSKLFTRLDELENGDLFYIRVLDEILAYEIVGIQVIEPNDLEKLKIVQGKDLVTLFTCTPYGINSHRLIVTGERTSYVLEEYENIEREMVSIREFIFAAIPIAFTGYGIMFLVKTKKKRGKQNEIKEI